MKWMQQVEQMKFQIQPVDWYYYQVADIPASSLTIYIKSNLFSWLKCPTNFRKIHVGMLAFA
jgi:hypothetical protein